MEKTEMMKRYEAETDECATWTWHEREFLTGDYLAWLEAKAAAYDRLMSGGKKTLKELANIFGRAVAVDANGDIESFAGEPRIDLHYGFWYCDENAEDFEDENFIIPKDIVDYTGDWKDSLTLPDGWEES